MDRTFRLRSMRVLGGLTALSACLVLASAGPASADPTTLAEAQQHYDQVKAQVRRLDDRAEKLTEQYNAAVDQLKRLKVQIEVAQRRLHAAQIKLKEHEQALGALMVLAYKDLDQNSLDIVLGASSLSDVTSSLDLQQRYDQAVADAVTGIREARDEILAQKIALEEARDKAER